jgi:hypothetical protein
MRLDAAHAPPGASPTGCHAGVSGEVPGGGARDAGRLVSSRRAEARRWSPAPRLPPQGTASRRGVFAGASGPLRLSMGSATTSADATDVPIVDRSKSDQRSDEKQLDTIKGELYIYISLFEGEARQGELASAVMCYTIGCARTAGFRRIRTGSRALGKVGKAVQDPPARVQHGPIAQMVRAHA